MVARRDNATIYGSHASGDALKVVLEIEDPRARSRAIGVDSDPAGRAVDRTGDDTRASSEEPGSSEPAQREFASQLALQLEVSRCRHEFDRLVLIAAPRLLGQLRAELSDHTRKLIVAELTKDRVEPDDAALRRQLGDGSSA